MGDKETRRIIPVVCLNCGASYVKPSGPSTVSTNPGCPACGYVGWMLASSPIKPRPRVSRPHSAGDHLRRRTG
jgi:transposase-like protein